MLFFYSLSRDDYLIKNKILAHCFLNSFYLLYMIFIIKNNVDIKKYLKKVINNLNKLSEMKIEENYITYKNQKIDLNKLGYKYIDLNNNACEFKELIIENWPKIFYHKNIQENNNLENNQNNKNEGNANIDGVNLGINHIRNEQNNNIIVNKDENIDINLEITQNPKKPIDIININIDEQILTSKKDLIKKNN